MQMGLTSRRVEYVYTVHNSSREFLYMYILYVNFPNFFLAVYNVHVGICQELLREKPTEQEWNPSSLPSRVSTETFSQKNIRQIRMFKTDSISLFR